MLEQLRAFVKTVGPVSIALVVAGLVVGRLRWPLLIIGAILGLAHVLLDVREVGGSVSLGDDGEYTQGGVTKIIPP